MVSSLFSPNFQVSVGGKLQPGSSWLVLFPSVPYSSAQNQLGVCYSFNASVPAVQSLFMIRYKGKTLPLSYNWLQLPWGKLRAEGANPSLSSYTQSFSLGATAYDQHEVVSALERLGNMNPRVWEEVGQNVWTVWNKLAKITRTKILRDKSAPPCRGEVRQHASESAERFNSKPKRRQISIYSCRLACFQLCYGCYFGHRRFIIEWMQKIKLCA